MAKKVFTPERHISGVETPRNRLELQIEASQRYFASRELPYIYQVEEGHSEKVSYPNEASMKKLIEEEMSKHSNTRPIAPSIVARLMGMDMIPSDTNSAIQRRETDNDSAGVKYSKKERNGRHLDDQVSSKSNSSSRIELHPSFHDMEKDADGWSSNQKMGKPKRREHPQEEELQKFKKEFEAWQADRFRESSRVIDHGSIDRQLLAQENLNKEKMVLHAYSGRIPTRRPLDPKGERSSALQFHGNKMSLSPTEQEKSISIRNKTIESNHEHPYLISHNALDKSSDPTKIVILKPGPERIYRHDEQPTSSSGTSEERASIEDFLKEVKERLKCEVQGKTVKRGPTVRGRGIETPFSERMSDPKQIAQQIAKQVRESASREVGTNFLRSESTRSSRSEIQFMGPSSPEYINRDSRRFLSERLRNVKTRETDADHEITLQTRDTNKARKQINDSEIVRDVEEMQTRIFRHGSDDHNVVHRELSPGNLVRSLSAPVSGTSFGKLLLEDRHILTGAHIQRKHEAIEIVSVNMKRQKKEKFNFKEKVSNFRYNLTLRGRLFGRKAKSMEGLPGSEDYHMKDMLSGPTVMMNMGERHVKENFTEVPPSPASVCSSAQEEFWKSADHLSQISTSDVTPADDNGVPRAFREISSHLSALQRQLNQLESNDFEEKKTRRVPIEHEIIEVKDPAEAFIRDLLVASGLYDGSSDKFLSRWNTLAKPISSSVFEEVQESYRKLEGNEISSKNQNENVNHMALLDLLNEALSTVSGPPLTRSRLRRDITTNSSAPPPLLGRKLLDSVWGMIRVYLYPPSDRSFYSLDDMMARDLSSMPWSSMIDDETNGIGKDMGSLIFRDLVNEVLNDFHL